MEFNGTFLASIISFIIFVVLMNKILYAPMQKIVMERKEFIDSNYSQAEENNQKADALNQEREEKLKDARNDARTNYTSTVNEYKEQRNGIVEQAQNQAKDELEQAYEHLKNISNETKEGLKGKMTELANDIVEKVLGYRSEVQGFDNDAINKILYH